MSDVDSKIKRYEDKLNELKMGFQDRAILQTGIAVSRIFVTICSTPGARFDPDKGRKDHRRDHRMAQ
jgi:hypothetical protein